MNTKDINIIIGKWEKLEISTEFKIEILLSENRFYNIFNIKQFDDEKLSVEYHLKEIEKILKEYWLKPLTKYWLGKIK